MLEILKFQYYLVYFWLTQECYHVLFFFPFLVALNSFLIIPVVKKKINVKLALAIPAGASITVVKEIRDT